MQCACRFCARAFVASGRAAIPANQPNMEAIMSYIDGFVLAVPNANREQFVKHARTLDAIFLEVGATRVMECWGDDVPAG